MKVSKVSAAGEELQLRGATLVLPLVTTGNVGQLAADLVLTTSDAQRIARLHSNAVEPCVCYGATEASPAAARAASALHTALELYRVSDDFVLVQQRSPYVEGRREAFVTEVADFCQSQGIARVILLASCEPIFKGDSLIARGGVRFADFGALSAIDHERLHAQGIPELEQSTSFEAFPTTGPALFSYFGPGSIVRHFVAAFAEKPIPCAVLMISCAEGDNSADAARMAEALSHTTNATLRSQEAGSWRAPAAWAFMYGDANDHLLV